MESKHPAYQNRNSSFNCFVEPTAKCQFFTFICVFFVWIFHGIVIKCLTILISLISMKISCWQASLIYTASGPFYTTLVCLQEGPVKRTGRSIYLKIASVFSSFRV
ncbi:hypothetical protein RIF29_41574 [Crotalaria pallida]|uniref:Uncharacterized protein n=1 Tax=Crotalaria pallida TaxID=3830 RepID=A0AAN9HRN2_CROPI